MLTVPDNRNEDNPAVADAPTTASAGEGVGSGGADGPRNVPPTGCVFRSKWITDSGDVDRRFR